MDYVISLAILTTIKQNYKTMRTCLSLQQPNTGVLHEDTVSAIIAMLKE